MYTAQTKYEPAIKYCKCCLKWCLKCFYFMPRLYNEKFSVNEKNNNKHFNVSPLKCCCYFRNRWVFVFDRTSCIDDHIPPISRIETIMPAISHNNTKLFPVNSQHAMLHIEFVSHSI